MGVPINDWYLYVMENKYRQLYVTQYERIRHCQIPSWNSGKKLLAVFSKQKYNFRSSDSSKLWIVNGIANDTITNIPSVAAEM